MRLMLPIALLAALLALCACGDSSEREPDVDRETVFDPLVENIDKAKEVEDQVMQHKDQIDEALQSLESTGREEDRDD